MIDFQVLHWTKCLFHKKKETSSSSGIHQFLKSTISELKQIMKVQNKMLKPLKV